MDRKLLSFLVLFLIGVSVYSARAGLKFSSAAISIQLQPVVSGLDEPLYLTSARDGSTRLFIVEKAGRIKVLQPGSTTPTVFLDITQRVSTDAEQGLLCLAFHPLIQPNRRLFVSYTRQTDGALVIAQYHVSADPNVADPTENMILTIPQLSVQHHGGMLAFGPDGYLYIGSGDSDYGNDPNNSAQNIGDLRGKILRIDIDHPSPPLLYSSPASNPFFGSTPGADEVFAYGFRNPWRFSFDRGTGKLYVADVGQDTQEEIDLVTLGGNYGWRVFEGTLCTNNDPGLCSPSNFIFPVAEYSHTLGRCAIIGGYMYRGTQSTLPLGGYIFGDLCTGEIFMLSNNTSTVLLNTTLSISSFGEDEAGEMYVVDLNGTVQRIVASSSTPPVAKCKNVTVSAGPNCRANASIDDGSFDPDAGDTITLSQSPLGPYGPGNTLVTLTVTDNHTVSSQCQATVTAVDTAPPVFTNGCPAAITIAAQASCPFATSTLANLGTPAATDNCTANPSVVCNPPSGSMFPVGTTTVTCTATDASNNATRCTFPVNVFSLCLQDDSNPSVVAFMNPATGDYLFCSSGVAIASGRGALTVRGCTFSIDHTKGDRTVHIAGDTGTGAGTAYIRKSNVLTVQITDRQMSGDTCNCSPPTSAPTKIGIIAN